MKFLRIIICILMPAILFAQENIGVKFETGDLTSVLTKAEKDHKYVFVDCSATWCNPCKVMDQEVFSQADLSDSLGMSFLFYRVQMDVNSADATYLAKTYQVNSYPTLLFFSPDGKAINKAVGFRDKTQFIELAKTSLDTAKQYYTLLDRINGKNKQYSRFPELVQLAKNAGEEVQAEELRKEYINNYLLKLPVTEFYTNENMRFVLPGLKSSDGALFNEISSNRALAKIAADSPELVDYYIQTAYKLGEIYPKLYKQPENKNSEVITKNPDWKAIEYALKKKLGKDYMEKTLLDAKVEFYNYRIKDMTGSSDAQLQYFEKGYVKIDANSTVFGLSGINGVMYGTVFKNVTDKNILARAAKVQYAVITHKAMMDMPRPQIGGEAEPIQNYVINYPNAIDTYANLLYKIGNKVEAIIWEKKALDLVIVYKDTSIAKPQIDEFSLNLQKMKAGQATW